MQNYANHRRLNPFHHFFLTPLTSILVIWTIIKMCKDENSLEDKIYLIGLTLSLAFITLISRMYALKNQNRIIRIEMRLRYFELTNKSFSQKENQLNLGQIIALRFAGDDELLELMERAISENLSNKEIKLLIKNWQADLNRV